MIRRIINFETLSRLGVIARRCGMAWLSPSKASSQLALARVSGEIAREPLSNSDQWAKLSGVLTVAIACADDACRRQIAATQQLDLAQYALSTLADELAAVMTLPGRRERAPIYRFEVVPHRMTGQALAA